MHGPSLARLHSVSQAGPSGVLEQERKTADEVMRADGDAFKLSGPTLNKVKIGTGMACRLPRSVMSRILELASMCTLRWTDQAAKERCQLKWSDCCRLRLFLACCAFTCLCVSHRDASDATCFRRVLHSEAWLPQRQDSKARKELVGTPQSSSHGGQVEERQY